MKALQEAMKQVSNAHIEKIEFSSTTNNMLIKKLREFVSNAEEDERAKIQELLETHIKQVVQEGIEIQMLKLMNQLMPD